MLVARIGIELGEGEILELVLHPVHADALGQRRIDVHRLARDPAALFVALDEAQRLHVVQAVGELDQQHADVLGHRQHELAEILGLLGLVGLQLDPRQLGDAVDQPRDLRTEHALDVVEGRDRVLDRVVQQPGDDRGAVELHLGEDAGDLDRMGEIGVARGAQLRAMRLHRIDVGTVERVLVGVRIVGFDPLDQLELPHHDEHLAVSSSPRPSGSAVSSEPPGSSQPRRPGVARRQRSEFLVAVTGQIVTS